MLFRWMGVHAAWPHFLVLCLVFEGMKRGGGWTGGCWQGGAGQAHHRPLTGPRHLINDPWIRYRRPRMQLHLNFRPVLGQRFAPLNCICGCRWECGMVTRAGRKVTTSPSLPPRSFSFSLPQMGYSGDGPDRPWFGFWFMFLWSSNQRFHLLLLYGSWDDEWCSLSVKPSLCVFAPHFNC